MLTTCAAGTGSPRLALPRAGRAGLYGSTRGGRAFREVTVRDLPGEMRSVNDEQNGGFRPLRKRSVDMGLLLLIVLLVLLLGSTPAWPYSRNWGYRPVSGVGVLLLLLVVLLLLDVVHWGPYPF